MSLNGRVISYIMVGLVLGLGIDFNVRLVSGYANVFVIPPVVIAMSSLTIQCINHLPATQVRHNDN